MKIRDRIKEFRRVRADQILPNPSNWRTHPQAQQDALRGILAEVGIADALLVRETPDGLQLIDGHLRADTAPDVLWPVLVLDVDESEAKKLLATVDPLAAMAETDPEKLDELLQEVETINEALTELFAGLADSVGLSTASGSGIRGGGDGDQASGDEDDAEGPGLGSPVIAYNLVFDTEDQQKVFFAFMRALRDRYPDVETHAERLTAFIVSTGVVAGTESDVQI